MDTTTPTTRTADRATLAFLILAILLGYAAFFGPLGQDWFPLHIAGSLARQGDWSAVYLPAEAQSLFDVSPAFRATARAEVPANAFDPRVVTAYLSPPPAAVLMMPLAGHWRISLLLFRLLIAGAMLGAIGLAWRVDARPWTAAALGVAPLLAYTVYLGQTSGLLLVPAVIAVLPPTKARDTAGGLALGLVVLTKATPLIAVVGLFALGRRRLALIAVGAAAVVTLAAWPWTGVEPWLAFWHSASRLSGVVINAWANVSVDAGVVRLSVPASDWQWWTLTSGQQAVAWSARIALLLAAGWGLWRQHPVAPWLAWLAATPVLWSFYLIVLVPSLVRSGLAWYTLAISAPIALAYLDGNQTLTGQMGTVVWCGLAFLLI